MLDTIGGFVAPGYERVRAEFTQLFRRGWNHGASYCAYSDGRPVVRLWGGVRDPGAADSAPYDDKTLQLVASATKFVESLCIALLCDRGLLTFGDRIERHWPGFGGGDERKAAVTVRQLMMHRAGLAAFDTPLTEPVLASPDALRAFLERQPLTPELFQPEPAGGERWRHQSPAPPQAYHAIARGVYAGALLRQVDPAHRTLGRFFQEEIAGPLGIDFFIGLPEAQEPRVSPTHADAGAMMALLAPPGAAAGAGAGAGAIDRSDPRYQLFDYELEFLRRLLFDRQSLQARGLSALSFADVPPQALANHRKTRAYELPSSSGVGSADALARLAALCAGGGTLAGTRIFAHPETLLDAAECADQYAVDGFMLTPIAFTQGGFARLVATDDACTPTIGWGGAGGQMVRYNSELGLACAYVTNTLGVRMAMHDPRANLLLRATLDCARRERLPKKQDQH